MENNVLELLENSAVRFGEKTAAEDVNIACSFRALRQHAERIGSALLPHGVFGQTVPVFMENSVLALETFLGVVYAGGSYSLMNPVLPDHRIEGILGILRSPVVITDQVHAGRLEGMNFEGCVLLAEDLLLAQVDRAGLDRVRERTVDTDPLYVNFTSGSTGTPKGVVVSHRSVLDFIPHFTRIFHITDEDRIGNQAPFDFDVSVKDIYSMLYTGAAMYIIPRPAFLRPKELLDILDREEITTLTWSVSALCMITTLKGFAYKVPKAVNKVLFSGEVMPAAHLNMWRRAYPGAMFVNLYGPTEITCNCTYYIIGQQETIEKEIPIGRPFPNERVFLLDESGHEVTAANMSGEICVAGSSLGLGYYKDPEGTKRAFVQNPLNDRHMELIYRTGDLAHYREDGNLVYEGRRDFQIKHLGHRIELFEIDAHMGMVEGVDRVCCLYDHQKQQIVAFYQGSAEPAAIKAALKQKLIKYMIPERFVHVEEMPLTANAKIDRKQLMQLI